MTTYRTRVAALVFACGMAFVQKPAGGADFHVANSVYEEGQNQPISQGITIFQEGMVYDFLNEPGEVIIFDKANRRFILLDTSRHVRSEISADNVKNFVDRAQQRLAGHSNPSMRWLADPVFEESFNAETSELTLKSPGMTYQVQVQATDPTVAAQYHEFSDWYVKFNFALDPVSQPPFPRMMLNEAIERHKGIAKEVHLTAIMGAKGSSTKITSRHQIALPLDSTDAKRTAEARENLQSFKSVSFREYQNPRSPAPSMKSK